MKLVRKDNHAVAIVATLESVLGTCGILEARCVNGTIEVEHDMHGTDIDWNSQETVVRDNQRMFVDENDESVPEDQCEVIEDNEGEEP